MILCRNPERLQMMINEYRTGASLRDVANRWNIKPEAVYGLFRYHNIECRSKAEGKRMSIQRRKMMQ